MAGAKLRSSELQADSVDDDQIKTALKEGQARVYAMSAVHEMLYESEQLSEIDLKTYLSKLTDTIFQTYSIDHRKVNLTSDIGDASISINQAYPLGLVVNELISNSLKYAFPNDKKGDITVVMRKLNSLLTLTVKDNGVGIPDTMDWKNAGSLGLNLVRTLVENQLGGSLDMEKNNGTTFTIQFTIET
ncbi:sensor histidine kinase [bacterium]|nr:sensor histidine kinase [bacterium]